MRRPSFAHLPRGLADATLQVVQPLQAAGHQAYLVGGAVRDLALEIEPHDVDIATSARPEEIEGLFPVAHAVGRAFGTLVVRAAGLDVQVTTFRSEDGYVDGRRPGRVIYGHSVEEDAARRDFTCNALYLEARDDRVLDPTGGLGDLAAGRLRCVGQAVERFTEDGLRLLRLARLSAAFGLAVEPATRAAAGRCGAALRGVSPERVRGELERLGQGPAPATGLALLAELGLWPRMAGLQGLATEEVPGLARRIEAVRALGPSPGPLLLLATLLRPSRERPGEVAASDLAALRPSRALADGCARSWALADEWQACLEDLDRGQLRPSRGIRLAREPLWRSAAACWSAWNPGRRTTEHRTLVERLQGLSPAALRPKPWITSAELAQAGVSRGARWGRLLREAEDAQLDGTFADRDAARAWLRARTSEERARRPDPSGGREDAP